MGLAAVAIITYAVSSAAMVSLTEPIFAEVLMSSQSAPMSLEAAPVEAAEDMANPGAVARLSRKFNARALLNDGYDSIKRRLGITRQNVHYFVPLLFLVVFLIRSLGGFLSGYSFQHIGLGLTTDMRNELFRRTLSQSSKFHAEHPSGELLSRIVNDVSVIQNAISTRVLDLFQQSVTLLALVLLLLSINFKLALICLVATPIFIYPIARFGKGMHRTSHRSQERIAEVSQLVTEAVRGHRVVKAFGMEDFENRKFTQATARHLRVKLRSQVLANVSGPVVESLAAIGSAAFLIYAGRAIRAAELTGPVLVMFLTNLLLLYDPIRKLNRVNLILQEASAAVQRVFGVLRIRNEITEKDDARELAGVEQGIRFEAVTFGYREEAVLREVNLKIPRGKSVALVGPSGAGKSTIVNLLPRFFDPDSGRVTIDGIDLRDLKLKSLSALIGLVTQETVLFNDTLRNNIAYGQANLPLERVREAAAAAYADDFIMELPHGYETMAGEAGMHLSGGQRQRVTIARALLKDPPILVLDEATSQLDSESEALVQKALSNLMRGRTTLVIAHRLSTIMSADRIVVMERGRVSETGTHAELLAKNGTYKRLYDLQFKV